MKNYKCRLLLLGSVALLFALSPVHAETPPGTAQTNVRGWEYLTDLLISAGISREDVYSVYTSPQIPAAERITFNMKPRENPDIYQVFYDEPRMRVALNCLNEHGDAFSSAQERFGVSQYILASILLVETQCGRFTGNHSVVYRLSRLATIPDPENVLWNFERIHAAYQKEGKNISLEEVSERAHQIQEIFLPQVIAYFRTIERKGLAPFELRGSIAGAFGIPQFLPDSYMRFAVDGNGNGKSDLFVHADAIHSAANYLKEHGWRGDLSEEEKRKVVWTYNRSDPYIDTILEMAARIERRHQQENQS